MNSESDWIFSEPARDWLARLRDMEHAGQTGLQMIQRLRRELPPEKANRLVELHELRKRGLTKFAKADKMFFTRKQLEQATGEAIANYKADRFHGLGTVVDLCSGIGGDAIALAGVANTTIVDNDPLVLSMARRNLIVHGRHCQCRSQWAQEIDVSEFGAVHVDPDRRIKDGDRTGRTTTPEFFSPNFDELVSLRNRNPDIGIKLAPATRWPDEIGEKEFIGHQRECKQQMVWYGGLMREPGIRVTVIANDGTSSSSFFCPGIDLRQPGICPTIPPVILDPHSALRAAGLVGAFALAHELCLLDEQNRILGSDRPIDSLLVSGFVVEAVCKPDRKEIRKLLQRLEIGTIEIRKTTDRLDAVFRQLKQLRLTGKNSRTIFLCRTPEGMRALITQRISSTPGPTTE